MRWYDRITKIDRRIIYLLLTSLVILPFFLKIPINQPMINPGEDYLVKKHDMAVIIESRDGA